LSQILNVSSQQSAPFGSDNDIMNAMRRIHFLLCQFVEIISTTSIVSVTLFLDDVQWVDEASVLVLNRILRREPKQFFFLCCYRDEEMKAGHPFLKMLENLQTFGINSTMIQLDCVTEVVLNEAISQLLCLSPRLVRSLSSIVFRKSKGNPLFVSQLLLSLNRDGLLRINLNRKRWVWNEEKILSTKLPDNVALCFTNGIKQLPIVVQVALHTLSMFGASVRVDCITWLESQLKIILTEPLKIAVSEGLVNIIRGSYKFAHDRIQEASYQMIQDHDRLSNHLIYGQCLVKIAIETGDDTMFFTAVNQINLGGPSAVTNREEYLTMAQHNWVAGKRSMAMSDFNTAHSFFDHSISFLRKNHWRDNYEFSLDLYECAARSALATGNSQSLQIVCDQTMRHAKCFEDKLSIYYILISSLALASKIQEALEKNLSVLSQLGEGITNNLSQEELDRQTHSTLASLIRVTSEVNIANHKVNTESNKLAAMKFLAQLHILAYLAQPVLHPFVVLKMIQITVAHGKFKSVILFCRSIFILLSTDHLFESTGLSAESSIGIACFGSFLARCGKLQLGCRFTALAKSLLNKFDSKTAAGEVLFIYGEIRSFVEPIQSANEWRIQGESAALSAGDIHFACYNRLQRCINLFWSGGDLSLVNEEVSNACQFMQYHGHKPSLILLLIVHRTVLILLGCGTESLASYDEWKNVEEHNIPPLQLIAL
jgi:predicted ATPase